MKCSTEALQAYLDNELEPADTDNLRRHLGGCPGCRQELSRLRLLWLELEQDEEIEAPPELPFLRQQVISRAIIKRREIEGVSGVNLWETQKLAWQPAFTGVSQIPGPRQLVRLVRATGSGVPAVIRGVSALAGFFAGRKRDRR